mmetsp:Transcript_9032/g.22036  ORF Transcript_9032/g.22036 Transcript_9032/m.22036 type:complete len:445 (-) Transcript_9032:196-1530(-)|eukprot:CAMPEP_0181106718 /NCGR_PEP_ID=MMETSP1071-20121207/16678_1 /TAXON_ID=35127 /ORGANISM="Thalassiosira sp., Strain NH16" /LENGTH=444 /DNA_ID=CAMNT_0023190137 /DNA_START=219 /DNA_END=1553 /DNA_ORIENTATION=-
MRLLFPTTLFLSWMAPDVVAQSVDNAKVDFQWSETKLPFPLSDLMANYVPGPNGDDDNGFVIITGGCNSLKGNERANFGEADLFACFGTSRVTLKFDPFSETFEIMAEAPHERQRHGAAVIGGKVYVVGGRDSNDELVASIDCFDPQANEWKTIGQVPEYILTSDLTAWAWGDYLYVAGGFAADYTAVGNTYRIDLSDDNLSFQELATSPHPRGDIHAIVQYGYAYVAGGLTHTSVWCEGLKTTERYSMEDNTWETLPDLEIGRADMAVASLNGKILAMGGETKPDDCLEQSDPAYGSFPADHVSLLLHPDEGRGEATWANHGDFKDERFRFAAATVPAQNRIYTFGGQLPYDFTCDCFPTSDKVAYGWEVAVMRGTEIKNAEGGDGGLSAGAIAGIVVGVCAILVLAAFGSRQMSNAKKEKESLKLQLANEQAAKANEKATDA